MKPEEVVCCPLFLIKIPQSCGQRGPENQWGHVICSRADKKHKSPEMTDLLAGVYDAALCHCGQESSHWEAPVTLNTLHLQSRKHHISPVRSSEPGVTFFQILLAAADVALEPKTAPPPVPIFSQSAVFLYYWLPVSFHTPRNIWSDHLCVPPAAQEPICSDRLLGFVLST